MMNLTTITAKTAHSHLTYKYAQDASGKLTAAHASRFGWRYSPDQNVEYYFGEDTVAGGDPTNALDQYASIGIDDSFVCPPKPATCSEAIVPLVQSYDSAGNLTSDGDGREYTYNSENYGQITVIVTELGDSERSECIL